MLKCGVLFFCLFLLSFQSAFAHGGGDIYTYLENPEPELYEFSQVEGPAPNQVITDVKRNIIRECWISHSSTDDIQVKLVSKADNINLCEIKISTTPYSDNPIWSIKYG